MKSSETKTYSIWTDATGLIVTLVEGIERPKYVNGMYCTDAIHQIDVIEAKDWIAANVFLHEKMGWEPYKDD